MNNRSFLLLILTVVVFATATGVRAQAPASAPATRPRTVTAAQQTQTPAQVPTPATQSSTPRPFATPTPTTTTPVQTITPTATPWVVQPSPGTPVAQPFVPSAPLQPARPLSINKFRERVAEAQKLLRSRLTLTSASPSLAFVTIAALEQDSSKVHTLSVPKEMFLRRGTDIVFTTAQGLSVRLQVLRPNYVNTAVTISESATGRQLTPLVVEYPIEKFGSFREMAYYTSAHPALLSPDVTRHGQAYVHNMLDLAAGRLKSKGKFISPEIVDIAERLCLVEHVDHDRFRREDRGRIYSEVHALFGLNELDTYRYSVSSAGAGGMVQMIPPTYQMVRRMHPAVGLNPDFVLGMRNHGNALEAMLLYMQDTWNDLARNQEVIDVMAARYATQAELVAAGYNSNPARLPLYIRRGGSSWRTLIPRETQVYLQIYSSVEGLVQFKNRGKEKAQPQSAQVAPVANQ